MLQVLYLKNLGPRVTVRDLVSLFARFQREDSPLIQFRLLSGRMRDQAFITFPGELLSCASLFFLIPKGVTSSCRALLPSLLSKEKQGNSLLYLPVVPWCFPWDGKGFTRAEVMCEVFIQHARAG